MPNCLSDISLIPKKGLVVVCFFDHVRGGLIYEFVRIIDGIYYISPFEYNIKVYSWDDFRKNNKDSVPLAWFPIPDNEDYVVETSKSKNSRT